MKNVYTIEINANPLSATVYSQKAEFASELQDTAKETLCHIDYKGGCPDPKLAMFYNAVNQVLPNIETDLRG